jgi:hypothetical protein
MIPHGSCRADPAWLHRIFRRFGTHRQGTHHRFRVRTGTVVSKWSFSSSARAGVYWHIPAFVRVQKIDVRVTRAAVTGQEVLTADGVPIKASVVGSYAVAQADRAILGADDYPQRRLQRTPACTPCGCDSDDIRRFARATIRALCALEKRSPPRDCGRSVSICSRRRFAILTFPGELKKIFTQPVRKGSRLSKRLEGRQRHCGTWRTPRR